ncbi:hypothetical protein [Litoribacillus peritrichatus]|uniref:PDZ domain-containing protein n=1 Tax=Litoribacillus peritrichatus TaxID=718191 RepID=A0ABP7N5F1_9GAMM
MKKIVMSVLLCAVSAISVAECHYIPQGLIENWSENRNLWEKEVGYMPFLSGEGVVQGLEVTHLNALNFLYEAGLRKGDILLELNSVSVSDSEAFAAEVSKIKESEVLELKFKNRTPLILQASADQCFN